MTDKKRLYRSVTDCQIAGICGGLAEYFNLDPLLVRILMVVLALATPAGFLFYILAWLFIPEAPAPEESAKAT
ncbi:MAG: PspC domain-containing protein [Chloroflexota bacterium]|nr:PspC domain-containing protein [Chloroflexota bacterium]